MERRTLLLGLSSALVLAVFPKRAAAASAQEVKAVPLDDSLQGWNDGSRSILRKALGRGWSGRLSPDDVSALKQSENATIDVLMLRLLPVARRFSRPPISNFHVGAVALGISGSLYVGANLEVPGNPLNQTVHAEQSAIANAFAHLEKGIDAIAVTNPPCGHCRQFLNEITNGSRIRIDIEGQPSRTVSELLPASFGPRDLGVTSAMFSSAPVEIRLQSAKMDPLTRAALEAASRSYAPYSKAHSGCAILMKSQRVFAGSYLENAAFNPSLSPLQSALVNAVLAEEDPAAIRRAVLVERKNAVISQRAATEAVLRALAPTASLEVLAAV